MLEVEGGKAERQKGRGGERAIERELGSKRNDRKEKEEVEGKEGERPKDGKWRKREKTRGQTTWERQKTILETQNENDTIHDFSTALSWVRTKINFAFLFIIDTMNQCKSC